MKAHATHPDVSDFDRMDALPTLGEVVLAARGFFTALLTTIPLTWR